MKKRILSLVLVLLMVGTLVAPAMAVVGGEVSRVGNVAPIETIDISSLDFNGNHIGTQEELNQVDELLAEQQKLFWQEHVLEAERDELTFASFAAETRMFYWQPQIFAIEAEIEQTQMRIQEIEEILEEMPGLVFLTYEDLINIGLIDSRSFPVLPITPPNTTNVQYVGQRATVISGGRTVNIFRITATSRNYNPAFNPIAFRNTGPQGQGISLIGQQNHTQAQFNRNIQVVGSNVMSNLPNTTVSAILSAIWNNIVFGESNSRQGLYLTYEGTKAHIFTFASNHTDSGFIHMQTSQRVYLHIDYIGRYICRISGSFLTHSTGNRFRNQVLRSRHHDGLADIGRRFVAGDFMLLRDPVGDIRWRVNQVNVHNQVIQFFDTVAGMPR